ncbi:MAG TPA: hypothetical protein VGK94_13055 [Candidatus Polarisedimenticolia bacterium]|jgi:hypothetical protein
MHLKKLLAAGGTVVAASLAIAMCHLHAFAFAPGPLGGADAFSPLFARRLEVGISGMDRPAEPARVARLHLYEDDVDLIFSATPISYCIGSACLESMCIGSACVKSYCVGSVCGASACTGSACGGSACIGSACIGSGCLGSACTQCMTAGEEEVEDL